MTHYDVVIMGGGQAGTPLAHALAKAGRKVALAERAHLGGSCVNFGCTPTKAAIASARLAHMARRSGDFGIGISSVDVDFPAVLARARNIALASRHGLENGMQGENPKLLRGHARLDGHAQKRFRVQIGEDTVTADQIVLNTGTRTAVPPIDGLTAIGFIHAGNWLDKPELPEHVAMLGGGAIGLEMAQFYRRMGSRVTVIENAPQIAGHEDLDIATAMQEFLAAEGIAFVLGASVRSVKRRGDRIVAALDGDSAYELEASHLFVATGRQPNTDDLGLETVGVNVSERGIIEVNERLETNVSGIWVAGDIRGGPQFTHTSWDDYRILFSQIAGDGSRTTERIVPYAIFTDPELGRVGATEAQARRDGKEVMIGRFEMSRSGKALEIGESEGFVKLVVEAKSKRILGAAVLVSGGAELVHSYIDLMNAGAPYTAIADAIHIHPTLAEAVQSAVAELGA